ncbi:hypothetical protein ACJRO7_019909 [Eucalyptus globulus]|uniref:O-methyltransferase dimerisation domain-containing protein n=1 Tax=Eucalyptus globulus TaxID=34317 RepID=A0ABD3KEY1_EUCGL
MMASSSSNEDESSSIALYAMQLATSSVVPMVLQATVELGVLEILEREGPDAMLSPSQIASKIPVKNNPEAQDKTRWTKCLASSQATRFSVSLGKDHQGEGGCRVYGLAPVAASIS